MVYCIHFYRITVIFSFTLKDATQHHLQDNNKELFAGFNCPWKSQWWHDFQWKHEFIQEVINKHLVLWLGFLVKTFFNSLQSINAKYFPQYIGSFLNSNHFRGL